MHALVIEYNDVFGCGIKIPDWYTEYASAKMTSVESDVDSCHEEYYTDPGLNRQEELFGEDEIADETQGGSTTRLLRDSGEGLIDTDPIRLDLQNSIDTDPF